MLLENKQAFLSLVRQGVGHSANPLPECYNWEAIKVIADEQGLTAIVLDGIDKLPAEKRPSQVLLLEWIGDILQNYEQRYSDYKKAIGSLAGFYNQHGFKMMVVKGYACSLNWPKPEHRPCGDIDIWQFGQQKAADAALAASSKFQVSASRIDNSHHHHTVFEWNGFTVENHYDFVNVHHSKSNAEIEKVFKELGAVDSYFVELYGEKFYLPSPNLHSLFLLRHAMIEFAAGGINLRQLLDWAFFVEKHGMEIDREWLLERLGEFHMREFFNCINAICVEELGFNSKIFPYVQFNPLLKDKILKDILEPEIPNEKPKNLMIRVIWKYRRWKANQWKHELCYVESMWSTFWYGVWSHLLKPKTI